MPCSCFFILRDDEIYLLVHGIEIQLIAIVILLSIYKRSQALKHRTTEVSTICKFKNSIKYLKGKKTACHLLSWWQTCVIFKGWLQLTTSHLGRVSYNLIHLMRISLRRTQKKLLSHHGPWGRGAIFPQIQCKIDAEKPLRGSVNKSCMYVYMYVCMYVKCITV